MYQATIGISRQSNSREAGLQAVHHAMSQMPTNALPTFGIVLFDYLYNAEEVTKGVNSLLGDIPYIGMSTTGLLTNQGMSKHAVVVALFYADDISAHSYWYAAYAQSGIDTARWLQERLENTEDVRALLTFADAFNGDCELFLNSYKHPAPVIGALAAGQIQRGRNYQIGSGHSGSSALTVLSLHGNLRMGYGYGNGWSPAGVMFRITRARGFWVRTLDGQPASDTYAHWFQFPTKDWAQMPLMSNVRLYPLGLETEDKEEYTLRAPLRVEIDGSFRMNAAIRDGQDAHLMIGSPMRCLEAARNAANSAILQLENHIPALALVLADTSWQMLMSANQGIEIETIRTVLGEHVPIIGGYTLGQIAPGKTGQPTLLNNHILVILFGSDVENEPVLPDMQQIFIPPDK